MLVPKPQVQRGQIKYLSQKSKFCLKKIYPGDSVIKLLNLLIFKSLA